MENNLPTHLVKGTTTVTLPSQWVPAQPGKNTYPVSLDFPVTLKLGWIPVAMSSEFLKSEAGAAKAQLTLSRARRKKRQNLAQQWRQTSSKNTQQK